jgi:hypothetical protein
MVDGPIASGSIDLGEALILEFGLSVFWTGPKAQSPRRSSSYVPNSVQWDKGPRSPPPVQRSQKPAFCNGRHQNDWAFTANHGFPGRYSDSH